MIGAGLFHGHSTLNHGLIFSVLKCLHFILTQISFFVQVRLCTWRWQMVVEFQFLTRLKRLSVLKGCSILKKNILKRCSCLNWCLWPFLCCCLYFCLYYCLSFASTFAYEVNYDVAYVVANTIAYSVAYVADYAVADVIA